MVFTLETCLKVDESLHPSVYFQICCTSIHQEPAILSDAFCGHFEDTWANAHAGPQPAFARLALEKQVAGKQEDQTKIRTLKRCLKQPPSTAYNSCLAAGFHVQALLFFCLRRALLWASSDQSSGLPDLDPEDPALPALTGHGWEKVHGQATAIALSEVWPR